MPQYTRFQSDLYGAGVSGSTPAFPMSYEGWHKAGQKGMSPTTYAYVAGSAGLERTERANREAFDRWQIVPRQLRGVTEADISVRLLGELRPTPLLLAPIGAMGLVRAEAELLAARAAAASAVPTILSTLSGVTMEQVAAEVGAHPNGDRATPAWFQLYWPRDEEVAASFVRRAEAAGFEALVLTVDTPRLAWRPRDLENAFLPFLHGEGLANYWSDPAFRAGLSRPPEDDPRAAVLRWSEIFPRPLAWSDLARLRDLTRLPLLVKGICHPHDAQRAVELGVDGLIVSNHGGRQVDGARPALDCLPEVVKAVGDTPVLFDSGIRSGSDVVKALALGARAVVVGRPYVFGLALGGQEGVEHVLACLLAELQLTMTLSGCAGIEELGRDLLVRPG